MILSCRYGKFLVPECKDIIVDSLLRYGEWAQAEIDVLARFINQGNIVIDAGSFIGTHSRAFSSMVGQKGEVHAFEPNKNIIPFLEANAKRSQFLNIVIHPYALGENYARMALINGCTENQGSCRLADCDKDNDQYTVEVRPLDTCGIKKVDFIKADVEGMELALLKGADGLISFSKPVIFVEANSLEVACNVLEWARQKNYLVYGIITMAFNPDNFNQEKVNIFGQSKECGLLLVHEEKKNIYLASINRLNLPEIFTFDDLALLLLHKPQYAYEILEKTKTASVLGIAYYSPVLRKVIAERDELAANQTYLNELHHQLALTQSAKDEAEQLALHRLAELDELHHQLALTQSAKDEAEQLALHRLAELDELRRQLALTQGAKDEAEQLALHRLAELNELRQQLALTQNAKDVAECRASSLEAQLDTIQSSTIWRIATRLGLNPNKGRKPRE